MKMSDNKSETAFRTISEVAEELGVQQHVLRFWETKFTQIKPMKRGGGRRYYRPEDVAMVKKIHSLLYVEGYTIKGVQKLLKGASKSQILAEQKKVLPPQKTHAHGNNLPQFQTPEQKSVQTSDELLAEEKLQQVEILQSVLDELLEMREQVRQILSDDVQAA
ncbi:MAG: MerR family transcriptional regulator [Alphaproteobacteria bacterium]|jgi:DNA-binding transcriptional MerR regulator|nr:MerR family transcriptional regulator [Alphaproteobacteria bacterium]MCB9984616.1 MerR family transcriptional regulator [Micavibrio sp.]